MGYMTFEAYTNPDFGIIEKLIFFFAAFVGVALCIVIIVAGAHRSAKKTCGNEADRRKTFLELSYNRVQLFYEMLISGTSVLSFSCAYVIANHLYTILLWKGQTATQGRFSQWIAAWEGGKDFILLLLICLSCILNTVLDRLVIPLKHVTKEEKASIRLLAMFYVIVILLFLNRIGDESEYNPVMMYYLGLMVGRFVYFDASFVDFLHTIKNAGVNAYLLLLGLLLTAELCYIGFSAEFLLPRNYYIVGVFYTDLFMLAVIFFFHHTRILKIILPKLAGEVQKNAG